MSLTLTLMGMQEERDLENSLINCFDNLGLICPEIFWDSHSAFNSHCPLIQIIFQVWTSPSLLYGEAVGEQERWERFQGHLAQNCEDTAVSLKGCGGTGCWEFRPGGGTGSTEPKMLEPSLNKWVWFWNSLARSHGLKRASHGRAEQLARTCWDWVTALATGWFGGGGKRPLSLPTYNGWWIDCWQSVFLLQRATFPCNISTSTSLDFLVFRFALPSS